MLFCYRWTLTINTEKNHKRMELLVGDSLIQYNKYHNHYNQETIDFHIEVQEYVCVHHRLVFEISGNICQDEK